MYVFLKLPKAVTVILPFKIYHHDPMGFKKLWICSYMSLTRLLFGQAVLVKISMA
jgi:hypothetical protein